MRGRNKKIREGKMQKAEPQRRICYNNGALVPAFFASPDAGSR